jgi:DNA-binding GntR family transcriptional regulator
LNPRKTSSGHKRTTRRKAKTAEPSLKSQSLTMVAYETLKQKIIVGFFLPGQYLNEAAIAEQLDLGRTPVHQALQRLQVEGLVEVVPRKGVIIQPDTAEQMLEILDARIVVEPELVRSATRNVTNEHIQELERILFSESRTAGGTIDSFIAKDREFHGYITRLSGNAVLGDFARMLHERSTRYWLLTMWQTLDTVATGQQHRAILQAIRKRDATAAGKAMRSHLMSLRDRITQLQRSGRLRR